MLRFKRIITAMLLITSAIIVISNNALSNPAMLKPVVSLSGKVIDKSDNMPVGTKINIYNEIKEKVGVCKSNDVDGSYFLTGLKPGTIYNLSVEISEITYEKIKIVTPQVNEYTEIVRDLVINNKENRIEVLTIK